MLHFPPLRTKRLTIQLKELTIGESIRIAAIPEHLTEAACTAFLKCAVETVTGVTDVAEWTVQERTVAVAHYLAVVVEDGPDFSLGAGRYSDYLDGSADADISIRPIILGDVGGDQWAITHLTGRMTESIERLLGEIDIPSRLHWIVGSMAAQLIRASEVLPETSTDSQYDEWLLNRAKVFLAFPESDFELLMAMYYEGREQLHHLFAINFNDSGICVLPKQGAVGNLPPARFRARAALSKFACAMG